MTKPARLLYGITAVVAWAALALQLTLSVDLSTDAGQSLAAAVWRYLGFFTVLTNLFVAIVASAAALAPRHRLASPSMRFAALVAIMLVGITYSLALRHIWNPRGWQAVADHALHDATPLLYLLSWIVAPHGALGRRDTVRALIFPGAYLIYAMLRGAVDGWYAYYFLDPSQQSWTQFLGSVTVIIGGVIAVGLLLIAADGLLARRQAD